MKHDEPEAKSDKGHNLVMALVARELRSLRDYLKQFDAHSTPPIVNRLNLLIYKIDGKDMPLRDEFFKVTG